MAHKKRPLAERFWEKVEMIPFHDCWEWAARKDRFGYGVMHVNGSTQLAHRICYEMLNPNFNKKLSVCHTCDNPGCVRPEHLFLGSHKENMWDREDKGRGRNKKSFSFEKAEEVRRLYKTKKFSQQKLSEMFGCTQANIGFIVRNVIWTK